VNPYKGVERERRALTSVNRRYKPRVKERLKSQDMKGKPTPGHEENKKTGGGIKASHEKGENKVKTPADDENLGVRTSPRRNKRTLQDENKKWIEGPTGKTLIGSKPTEYGKHPGEGERCAGKAGCPDQDHVVPRPQARVST